MTIEVAALSWVPPFAHGHVRDLRVRWALEEAGLGYEAVLHDPRMPPSPDYLHWQPFGQVPAYRDDTVTLFESGAIVLHIAGKSPALAPADPEGHARMIAWVFAALNTLEPHVQALGQIDVFHAGEAWTEQRRPQVVAMVEKRLAALATWLGDREYLEDRFTAGDLIMTTVLRGLVRSGILARYPRLDAYRQRCEARPAFGRALEAQLRPFRESMAA